MADKAILVYMNYSVIVFITEFLNLNKVCDINRADVKSLFTLYRILWKHMLLGKRDKSNHIAFHSHHQFLLFIPSEHHF